nr:hypothetical protein [Abalone asfa-like virus]
MFHGLLELGKSIFMRDVKIALLDIEQKEDEQFTIEGTFRKRDNRDVDAVLIYGSVKKTNPENLENYIHSPTLELLKAIKADECFKLISEEFDINLYESDDPTFDKDDAPCTCTCKCSGCAAIKNNRESTSSFYVGVPGNIKQVIIIPTSEVNIQNLNAFKITGINLKN